MSLTLTDRELQGIAHKVAELRKRADDDKAWAESEGGSEYGKGYFQGKYEARTRTLEWIEQWLELA